MARWRNESKSLNCVYTLHCASTSEKEKKNTENEFLETTKFRKDKFDCAYQWGYKCDYIVFYLHQRRRAKFGPIEPRTKINIRHITLPFCRHWHRQTHMRYTIRWLTWVWKRIIALHRIFRKFRKRHKGTNQAKRRSLRVPSCLCRFDFNVDTLELEKWFRIVCLFYFRI